MTLEDRNKNVMGWFIAALLSAMITGASVIWQQQRQEIRDLQQVQMNVMERLGKLEGTDNTTFLKTGMLEDRVRIIEHRQHAVIGVLATIKPTAVSAIETGK